MSRASRADLERTISRQPSAGHGSASPRGDLASRSGNSNNQGMHCYHPTAGGRLKIQLVSKD